MQLSEESGLYPLEVKRVTKVVGQAETQGYSGGWLETQKVIVGLYCAAVLCFCVTLLLLLLLFRCVARAHNHVQSRAMTHPTHASNHLQKWRLFSPLGLALVGLGASILGHSIELKTTGATFMSWFVWGTMSLIVLNAGLAVFGDAVKHRVLFELTEQLELKEQQADTSA